eukprot:5356598-Prymnesium_polylepis.2
MHEKEEELPKELILEKAEKERLEEIVKQKAVEVVMGKVDKAATKTKMMEKERTTQASGSSSKRRK